MERTLVVIKPDGVKRGLIGEITARFEKVGLKVVAARFLTAERNLLEKHYPENREELWIGIGNKTLENYKQYDIDPVKSLGTADPLEIGKMVRVWLMDYVSGGPVFAMVLEAPHAVELVRKMAGHTLPLISAPGTIRGDYAYDSSYLANSHKRAIENLLHASGTKEEADYEIPLWFTKDQIHSY